MSLHPATTLCQHLKSLISHTRIIYGQDELRRYKAKWAVSSVYNSKHCTNYTRVAGCKDNSVTLSGSKKGNTESLSSAAYCTDADDTRSVRKVMRMEFLRSLRPWEGKGKSRSLTGGGPGIG
jgi:hypothetical protein